jgi:hypothetical protein
MTNSIQQINASLAYVANLGQKSHAAGDEAAKRARAAKDRRTERKMQTVNKAHRATGTACEASLWLSNILTKRLQASSMPPAVAQAQFLRFTTDSVALVDDLNFEANVISALQPEPTKSSGKR